MPKVDSTDFYMFRSYESGRAGYTTLIADYQPFQPPFGGPNYFFLDPDALYRIHIDNTGDGVEDITFQFRVAPRLVDIQLPVGGKNVSIPLYNIGPFTGDAPGNRSPNLNIVESFTMWVIRGEVGNGAASGRQRLRHQPQRRLPLRASRPTTWARSRSPTMRPTRPTSSRSSSSPAARGATPSAGSSSASARSRSRSTSARSSTWSTSTRSAPATAEPNPLENYNITTIALEVPTECLTKNATHPVIGGWQTASLPRKRVLSTSPTFTDPTNSSGDFVQVSRLGMPLVNEVVIGLKDKDLFNAASPKGDAALATYITNPTLPAIIQVLFGSAGVKAPTNFPRTDLVATFATGIQGLNFLSDGQPHEMQRLNTSIAPTPAASQNNLGVLGGDNAGFPNGRRPGDDVTDIELRVAMGVLCHAFPGVYCNPGGRPLGHPPLHRPGAPGRQPVRHHLPLHQGAAPGLAERPQRSDPCRF